MYASHLGEGGVIPLDVRLPLGGVSHWMYASHLGEGGGVIPLDVRLPLGGGGG